MKHLRKFNESISLDKNNFVELEESGLCKVQYWGDNRVELLFTFPFETHDSKNVFDLDSRVELNDSKTEYFKLIKKCVDTMSYEFNIVINSGNHDSFILSFYSKEEVEEYFTLDDDTVIISKKKLSRLFPNIDMNTFSYHDHWISLRYKAGSKVSKDDMYRFDLISKIPNCGSSLKNNTSNLAVKEWEEMVLIDSTKYKFSIVD